MYMNRDKSGGYAGLISLLITSLIMAILFWRMDLFSGNSKNGGVPPVEQNLNAIQAAKDAKQLIENRYNQQMTEVGNYQN